MPNNSLYQIPPHNLDAEQAVLGACLLDAEAIHRIDWLPASAFYKTPHQLIYDAMRDLAEAGTDIDLLTLTSKLRSSGDLEGAGGEPYLGAITDAVPTSVGLTIHAGMIRDHAVLRELIIASTEIISRAQDPEMADIEKFAAQVERTYSDIAARRHSRGLDFKSLDEIIPDAFERIEAAYSGPDGIGIPSGIAGLDRLTGGFFPGELLVIGGRPGMGKTALAVCLSRNMAAAGRKVAFFSFEMTPIEMLNRFLSIEAGVSLLDIRTGWLTDADYRALTKATAGVSALPVYLNDARTLKPSEGFSALRRLRAKIGGLDAVVIDYLQLMSVGRRVENRTQEITEITRELKKMAGELGVPVILLSQLSRKTEGRENPRPVMGDLRDSGSIEQDADLILFPFRPVVYSGKPEDEGIADLIIGKQRNGPGGDVIPLRFEARTADFTQAIQQEVLV